MKTQSLKRNNYFSPGRFFLLLKRDFLTNYRTIIITTAAVAGFVIFSSSISALTHSREEFHSKLYFMLLYLGGFIVTSRAFKEMYNSRKSYTYVTLPGSTLEKFSVKLISTSIGYVLGTLLIYSVIAAISEGLNQLLFGYTHALLSPFSRAFLIGAAAFLVIQGLFLAGAAFFKKNAFIKTILTLTLLAIALLIFATFAARLIFPGSFEGLHQMNQEFNSMRELTEWLGLTEVRLRMVGRTIRLVLRILFWAVLAPLCWTISYLKFRKIEA
ncbi:MAG: hypothetical protein KAT88_07420 [Spirochaetes bacterium]|nr:hypothetical protein [Spirochaetota bacterium]